MISLWKITHKKLNISGTTWASWSNEVSKCSARHPESIDVPLGGVGNFRRERSCEVGEKCLAWRTESIDISQLGVRGRDPLLTYWARLTQHNKLNISVTTWASWSNEVSKCSARHPESIDVPLGGVGNFRRELATSGQIRVGRDHVKSGRNV
jgi:hypothetical protein